MIQRFSPELDVTPARRGDAADSSATVRRLAHLVAFLEENGWSERSHSFPEVRCYVSPDDIADDSGKPLRLLIPSSARCSDASLRIEEAAGALSRIYEKPAETFLGLPDEDARLRSLVADMLQGRAAGERFFDDMAGTIRRAVARVVYDARWRNEELEDLVAEARRKVLERIGQFRLDIPVRLQVFFVAKRTAYSWLRRKRRELDLVSGDVDLVAQEAIDESGWPNFEQFLRHSSDDKAEAEDRIAVLGLLYVEGELTSPSARLNVIHAAAMAGLAGVVPAPSYSDLKAELPRYDVAIDRVFEAAKAARLSSGPIGYDHALEAVWPEIDAAGSDSPGLKRWRKPLLRRVGATPSRPQLDLSGSVLELVGREYRRLSRTLNETRALIETKIVEEHRR